MDIKGDWKKRAVCGLMVLAMALSLLPTSILAADTRSVTENAIKNGSFEEPAFHDKNSPQWPAKEVPDWDTTASDRKIEFGSRRNGKDAPQLMGDQTIPDGSQFAELNADEESTLYQYAETVGGNVYEWGLSHRGREGDDHMALIIGPKQDEKPDKPNKAGKDQFMRMTDWVKSHAEKLGVNIPVTGCTQKITVYSKKFAANGGFQNDIGDAFSASPSDVYTEKWNVWIIGTNNNAWGNYGTKSPDYAEGKLAYSCRYAVPDGQTKTVFAFCSYSAATSNKTLGNLIDNIHFSLYQTITAAATAGGSGFIGVPTGGKNVYYEIRGSMSELVVANGSPITVKAVEPESDDVQFVGAYVTRQTQNGLKKEFIPATSPSWDKVDRTYTYEHPVEEPADIVLVFVKKPMVIYEANGGKQYTHGDNGTNAVSFAPQVSGDGSTTARGPYDSKEATPVKDGWRFDGWLLPQKNKVLPAVHTVKYDTASETFTFTADDGTKETLKSGGATLIAQWKWRQRFVTASRVRENGTVSADIRENTECGSITVGKSDGSAITTETNGAVTDYYSQANEKITATATAKAGYEFIGWYQQVDGKIDGKVDGKKYELISNQKTYTYTAKAEGVQTVYARFAPTHTVKYQWTKDIGKCPQNKPEPPSPGTVIDGGTYYISKDFIRDKTTIDGTGTKDGRTVPGKWVFTGWHDGEDVGSSGTGGDIVIRETELINVTGDRTLTGFWTFIPEEKHTLTYQFADNTRWSPSGSFELTENYYRGESVTAQAEPARNQTTDGEDVLVTGNVTLYGDWSFKGWQRSDTKDKGIVAAGDGFDMPGNDLTLTGQWEFTPYTYTVVYDTGDGEPISDPKYASYDYAALLGSSKPGLDAPTGIPFGASIKLMELPDGTEIPDDKYFAGWSLVKPENNLSTIETQAPGDSVGFRKLEVTENGQEVKLYAVYKNKDVATVDFAVNDSNWGDVNPKSGSFMAQNGKVDEGTVSSTAAPRDGYHFVGWYEESDDGKLEPVNGSAINGTTLTVTAAMMQAKLKPLAESRGENRTPVLEVRYIAVFARDSFTVKFDGNGDDKEATMKPQTFPAPDSEEQLTTLRKNEFKRPGYVFTGWAEYPTREVGQEERTYADKEPFAEVTIYRGEQISDGDMITLYAQWEKLPDVTISYTPEPTSLGTVKLNPTESNELGPQDGMVSESLNPETGTARGATAVPEEGSVFVGWYDAQGKHLPTDGTTYTPEKDSSGRYRNGSYVALFRLKQYVLHYDANAADAAGTMEDQTFPHGQAHPLKKCAFSREGYRFEGWATEQKGKVEYEDQTNIKLDKEFPNLKDDNDEVTLYAVWHEQSVTLGYEPNDAELGSVSSALETVAAVKGTAKGSTAQPKSGARFDGWYSADGTLLSKELTFVPTKKDGAVWQGTTYYAHFSAKRSPSTPSTPAKPDETKLTLAPIPEMLNGEDHYAYLLGYEDGTVRPNGSISRAEVATVLFRLLKDDVRMQNLTKDNAYSDVSDTAWYAAAVSTLSKMGIISGYPDGTFRPNAPITRAEFAAMIARFDETAKSADTPFTDISGHWAENAIGKAYGNGWVEGSSKTVFCPESNLTRAETATLLNRVLHRLPEKESDLLANQIVWPDNPKTFWGYLAIQEATNSHEYERKADGVYETQTAKRENRDWSKEFEQ